MPIEFAKHTIAPTPPMGWNSWDCFGSSVTENEVRKNAEFMAENLKSFGWTYIVVDLQWYEPAENLYKNGAAPLHLPPEERYATAASGGRAGLSVEMDEFGRLFPSTAYFPSAANGNGFAPLADYIHSLGLKFGIHVMRGIPREAVRRKTRIEGTSITADQIADRDAVCGWNVDNFAVDMNKPGAQDYYNSLARLYSSWGVDFIKADDMLWEPYHEAEIEAFSKALAQCGSDIVFSLSPGIRGVHHVEHLQKCAHMWRISHDFWDAWDNPMDGLSGLKGQFILCANWAPYSSQGHWPDADMLPFGKLGKRDALGEERMSRLTEDEQIICMSLWAIFRSPLMFGGDMTEMDPFTLSLLTNPEVIEVNQASMNNRQIRHDGKSAVWAAEALSQDAQYVGLFNLSDETREITCDLDFDLALSEPMVVRDLWQRGDIDACQGVLRQQIPPHGAKLLKLSK